MIHYLKHIYSACLQWIEKFKGTKNYTIDIKNRNNTEVIFVTHSGIRVEIRVLTHYYDISYQKSDYWNRYATIFEVTGTLPLEVDERIRKVYETPLYFPMLLSKNIVLEKQIEAVVNAFLDIKKSEANKLDD